MLTPCFINPIYISPQAADKAAILFLPCVGILLLGVLPLPMD